MRENPKRKPDWLRVRLPAGERFRSVSDAVSNSSLHTVCQEARCPNIGECWNSGTATFLILGSCCSRGCAFCAVDRGDPAGKLDPDEPDRVASAAARMGLDFAVVTSVTRDDLADGGASVFAATVRALKSLDPAPLVELLTPDYLDEALATVLGAGPDVFAHNIEVVERLTPALRHSRFSYGRSIEVLRKARAIAPGLITKSSIMLGIGETDAEIEAAMRDLRAAGVNILVLGQYLRPTTAHAEVARYVPPDRFDALADLGKTLGFDFVAAGPLVRTSYKAAEAFARKRARCPHTS